MTDALDTALASLPTYDVRFAELEAATSEVPFVEAGFGLLGQSLKYLYLTACMYKVERPDGMDRNEAIVVGQLVRMYKLVHAILGKAQQDRGGDQHTAVARQFLEGVSVIEYLTQDIADGMRFDAYVQDGLIAEKEFAKVVATEVAERDGKRWEIEDRLDTSINGTFRRAGVDKDALPGRKRIAFPNVETRLNLIGPTMYGLYRASSGGIHGTWNDIGNNHLTMNGDKFHPDFEPNAVRPQIFTSMALWGTRACLVYVKSYLPDCYSRLQPRMGSQIETVAKVDELHEKWLNSRESMG
ncbi:DUF5677 domain-containing protein [Rhodococcus kronopolitis]|uniref:DUF5677 domain-containing protein n=1 Tax=Rhodococcus kronopolitis TaxID=1460226 RepID=A0ABV9FLN6_9NOCA